MSVLAINKAIIIWISDPEAEVDSFARLNFRILNCFICKGQIPLAPFAEGGKVGSPFLKGAEGI